MKDQTAAALIILTGDVRLLKWEERCACCFLAIHLANYLKMNFKKFLDSSISVEVKHVNTKHSVSLSPLSVIRETLPYWSENEKCWEPAIL